MKMLINQNIQGNKLTDCQSQIGLKNFCPIHLLIMKRSFLNAGSKESIKEW